MDQLDLIKLNRTQLQLKLTSMNYKAVYFFYFILFLQSCGLFVHKYKPLPQTKSCYALLDSLSETSENAYNHGILGFRNWRVDIAEFNGISKNQLEAQNLPTYPLEQQKYKYNKILKGIKQCEECYEVLTKEYIIAKLGSPYKLLEQEQPGKITGVEKLYFKIGLGKNCPDCYAKISKMFDNCGHIMFEFKNNRLQLISISTNFLERDYN